MPNTPHFKLTLPAFAALLALNAPTAGQAQSQNAASKSAAELESVIVTGTRSVGTKATASISPIAIVTADDLASTGQRNVIDALIRLEPSFNALARGGDFVNIVRSASLRGLGPNQTLVLVNGKRRHTTAYIATAGVTAGSAAVDLDQIPVSAIERIEVLKDGASAQYGSDAIAGVINIILKTSDSEGTIDLSAGRYHKSAINPYGLGNGQTLTAALSKGFALPGKGFLNLSGEWRDKKHTNQTGPELRTTTVDPFSSKISGDPAYTLGALAFNAGLPLTDAVQGYAFGTYSTRKADSYQNFRLPTRFPIAATLYPQGFGPSETSDEKNNSLAAGVKGAFAGNGRWDFSIKSGGDTIDLGLEQTVNIDLLTDTGSSPVAVYIGRFANRQTTTNLDFSKPLDVGLAGPLDLAGGAELRQETYKVTAGEPASYYKGGTQAFVGLTPYDAGSHDRKVSGLYVDATLRPATGVQLGAAVRTEHYSDFGNTSTGKLSARWDLSKTYALRSTVSTGYRAPNLAEQYYSATNVSPTTTSVQLPANSPAAQLAGAQPLKPEKSDNLSVGFVATPAPGLRFSADAYRISIKDRIVLASGIKGAGADAAIAAQGITIQTAPGTGSVAYFANGIDTRTSGLDLVGQIGTDFDSAGYVKWTLAGNFKNVGIARALPVFTPSVLSTLTDPSPKSKLIGSADWTQGPWSGTLRVTRYGAASLVSPDGRTGTAPYYRSEIDPAFIVDAELGYELPGGVKLTTGANNLFNKYPNQVVLETILPTGAGKLPGWSPYGYNGAFYYVNLSAKF